MQKRTLTENDLRAIRAIVREEVQRAAPEADSDYFLRRNTCWSGVNWYHTEKVWPLARRTVVVAPIGDAM